MSRDNRAEQKAQLRRNLIPALTRLKDYEGATDQYIAILSAHPEDASPLDETISYALRFHREQQLTAFGNKAATDSPQDSRFAILLARAVPEAFWTSFTSIGGHLGECKIAAMLKPEMDAVVRDYIAKNGAYESESVRYKWKSGGM